jgi:hypothetical protein
MFDASSMEDELWHEVNGEKTGTGKWESHQMSTVIDRVISFTFKPDGLFIWHCVIRRDFLYTMLSALEFWKIFRGECEKNNFIFSLFAHFAKWASKNIWAEDKIKIKIYSGIKFCSETGLNILIFSCFACFGAPYLQWRWCRGGWNKNKDKKLIFSWKWQFC